MLAEVVSLGGDTDTIASMAGQLRGAGLGVSGLPEGPLAAVGELAGAAAEVDRFAAFIAAQSGF